MDLRVWYFVTLVLTALPTGTSFAHTLELPAKMKVDGRLWLTFQRTLYRTSRMSTQRLNWAQSL
jgi:hypothetical protein